MKLRSRKTARLVIALCFEAVILGGCGQKSGDQPAAAKGQVVARISDEVVTIQELENEFRWANIPADRQKDPDLIKRVLGELVVRKYLLRQAITAKLDREPNVLLDLLRSREQILESAYLVRKASAKAPGKADFEKFIANNSAKFAGRKLFGVEQIVFVLSPSTQSFIEANRNVRSLDEVDQKLTAAGVPHGRQMGVLNSGDIAPELNSSIEARREDDVFFVRAGPNGVFFKVKNEEAKPLDADASVNLARQLMRNDAVKGELGLASYSANLEAKFEGEYEQIMRAPEKKN